MLFSRALDLICHKLVVRLYRFEVRAGSPDSSLSRLTSRFAVALHRIIMNVHRREWFMMYNFSLATCTVNARRGYGSEGLILYLESVHQTLMSNRIGGQILPIFHPVTAHGSALMEGPKFRMLCQHQNHSGPNRSNSASNAIVHSFGWESFKYRVEPGSLTLEVLRSPEFDHEAIVDKILGPISPNLITTSSIVLLICSFGTTSNISKCIFSCSRNTKVNEHCNPFTALSSSSVFQEGQ